MNDFDDQCMIALDELRLPDSQWCHDSLEENLTQFSIAYGHHFTIPAIQFYEDIEVLDISHNNIRYLDALQRYTQLNSLVADANLISENTILPYMPKLELLWMNHCKINILYPWIMKLRTSCPNLKFLSLMNNPAIPSYLNGGTYYEYLQYRMFVVSLFPKLKHLDDKTVSNNERNESIHIYKLPLLDRIKTFDFKMFSFPPKFIIEKKWHDVFIEQPNNIIDVHIDHRKMTNCLI